MHYYNNERHRELDKTDKTRSNHTAFTCSFPSRSVTPIMYSNLNPVKDVVNNFHVSAGKRKQDKIVNKAEPIE